MVIFHSYVNVYQRAHGTPLKIFIPTFTGLLRRPQKWGYLWLGRIKEVFHDRCVAALWLPCSYVIQKWNNPLGGNLLTLQVSPIPIVTNSIWFHQTWWTSSIFVNVFPLPSGYDQHSYGKSPFFMGKSTRNGPFSIAMFVYQRVNII